MTLLIASCWSRRPAPPALFTISAYCYWRSYLILSYLTRSSASIPASIRSISRSFMFASWTLCRLILHLSLSRTRQHAVQRQQRRTIISKSVSCAKPSAYSFEKLYKIVIENVWLVSVLFLFLAKICSASVLTSWYRSHSISGLVEASSMSRTTCCLFSPIIFSSNCSRTGKNSLLIESWYSAS